MTPAEAAAALFKAMPPPISIAQLEEYGIEASESSIKQIAREILSLNLFWVLAAIDAHLPTKYRGTIKEELFESIKKEWWTSGQLGADTWENYQPELHERREHYARLVDEERLSHAGICAEAASLLEDQGLVTSDDLQKLLVLLIDYAPASEYGRLLDEV